MKTNRRVFALGLLSAVVAGKSMAGEPHAIDLLKEQKYANVIYPVSQFGTFGLEGAAFNSPFGIYINDTVFVADTYNDAVKEFSFDGTLLRTISGSGGLFSKPWDIAVDERELLILSAGTSEVVVLTRGGTLKHRFGKLGGGQGQFSSPHSLATNARLIAVSDTGNDRVLIHTREGSLIRSIGGTGATDGLLSEPLGVAYNPEGFLYVVDSNNNRIQKFSPEGDFVVAWGQYGSHSGDFAQPVGISVIDGRVYVADTLNHRVQVFDQDGNYLFQFGRHPVDGHEGNGRTHYPYRVSGLADRSKMALVEPNENRVQIFDLAEVDELKSVDDDAWWGKGTKFHYGRRLIAPNNGIVAVSEPDTHAVILFRDEAGTPVFTNILGGRGGLPGQFIQPSGIEFSTALNKLFVSDSGNRRIQAYSVTTEGAGVNILGGAVAASGRTPPTVNLVDVVYMDGDELQSQLKVFSGPTQVSTFSPSGMRIGPDGLLYVIDPYNGRIAALDQEYRVVRTIGRNATVDEVTLRFPLDMAFGTSGQLFVADAYNARIVVFNLEGTFQHFIGGHISQTAGALSFVAPFGITGGIDGKLYITDEGQHKIFKVTEQGDLIDIWGGWGTGPNEYYKPKGIAQTADGAFLYIVDFGNHRAQKITSEGEYVLEFGVTDAVVDSAVRP